MQSAPHRQLGAIAMKVGFSEQSDFSRVFKRHYVVAPTEWDRRSRLDLQLIIDDYDRQVADARAAGPEPVVELRDYEACRVAYVRVQTPFLGDLLRAAYWRLVDWLRSESADYTLRAGSSDCPRTTPLERVSFDFGFEVPERLQDRGEFGVHQLPAHRAACVRCDGPLVRVALAWEVLSTEWLPRAGFEAADLPGIKCFHRLLDHLGRVRWTARPGI